MRIVFDSSKCMGCGLCANLDPDYFGHADGKAVLISGKEISAEIYEAETINAELTEQAASVCPVLAISVIKN